MNSFVSLITASSKSASPSVAPDFAPPPGEPKTTFSSVLERTLHRPAERPVSNAKAWRSRSERAEISREEGAPAEHRPPVRKDQQRKDEPTDQSLAGACAVQGQAVPLDEPTPVASGTGEVSAETSHSAAGPVENQEASTNHTGEPDDAASTAAPVTGATAGGNAAKNTNVATAAGEDLTALLTPVGSQESQSTASSSALVSTDPKAAATAIPGNQPAPATDFSLAAELKAIIERELSAPAEVDAAEVARISQAKQILTGEVSLANAGVTAEGIETPTENASVPLENIAAAGPVSPEDARRTTRAARLFRQETADNERGIGGAQPMGTMKTALRKEEIAGGPGQLLPASATAVSLATNLSGEARRNAGGAVSSETVLDAGRLTPAPVRADFSETIQPAEARTTSPLLRVSELISREVRMFKRAGDELVEVVLTPDVKTQISLRLQWREGQVEVQARCDFGDHQVLNTEWPQLQASLAAHGVRLSHLSERTPTGFTDFFNHPNFSQRNGGEQSKGGENGRAENLPPGVPISGKSAAAPAPPRSNRLFDFWA